MRFQVITEQHLSSAVKFACFIDREALRAVPQLVVTVSNVVLIWISASRWLQHCHRTTWASKKMLFHDEEVWQCGRLAQPSAARECTRRPGFSHPGVLLGITSGKRGGGVDIWRIDYSASSELLSGKRSLPDVKQRPRQTSLTLRQSSSEENGLWFNRRQRFTIVI